MRWVVKVCQKFKKWALQIRSDRHSSFMRCLARFSAISFLMGCLSVSAQDSEAQGVNIFVAPDGNDKNPGIQSQPKATINGALETLRQFRGSGDITSEMAVNVWVRGGRYALTETVHLSSEDSGSEKHPFRISAWENEKVILDGRREVPRGLFKKVEGTDVDRLSKEARGNVLVAVVPEGRAADELARAGAQMSYGGRMLQKARFPNVGFMVMDRVLTKDSAPANTKGTEDNPVGSRITFKPGIPGDWADEVNSSENARLGGYISETWLYQHFVINSMESNGAVQLRDASAYGLPRPHISRGYLENVLPALDQQGEWFYDPKTRQLFIWPPDIKLGEGDAIGVWASSGAFALDNTQHVHIERFVIENLMGNSGGDGGINITSGEDNLVAGCTFRNISSPASAFNVFSGYRNKILSCNIFDVTGGGRLYGGEFGPDGVTPGENVVENCHYTQLYSTNFYGKVIAINGAGNIFRNNLAHNHNGQIVTLSGVEHLVEKNEIFNTGVEEGDGGAFYQGAMLHSWGTTFRHNFFHHIMCVPTIYTRAAIFSDDGDCGDLVEGNVFYKAGEGFKTNVGSGHIARDNLTIKGIHSFQVLPNDPKGRYNRSVNYLKNNPRDGAKDNWLGKGLAAIGVKGWEQQVTPENWHTLIGPYWYDKYPRMERLFANWQKRKSMDCVNEFTNNHAFEFSRNPMAIPGVSVLKGNTDGKSLSVFKNPKSLNFAYRSNRPKWAPDIPFEKIGLVRDKYRQKVPDKDGYRAEVTKHWRRETSAAPREYKVRDVNKRCYYNTGLVVLKHLK